MKVRLNTRVAYLYRNGHGQKYEGSVVFSSPKDTDTSAVMRSMLQADSAGGQGWFTAHTIGLPELFPWLDGGQARIEPVDGCWHIIDGVCPTHADPTDRLSRTIGQFLLEYRQAAKKGWEEFNPAERPICPACGTGNDPRESGCAECGTHPVRQLCGFGQGT